jgi:aminoglycoside phosphotransferase (APT) family kinase protein
MKNTGLNTEQISEKLIVYLRDKLENPDVDYAENLEQLQGGYETVIYRFRLAGVRDQYSQAFVLRLYPKFYGTQNATWESTVQNVLAGAGYPAAKVHFVCVNMSILGGAFFIMDHIPGQLLMFTSPEIVPQLLGRAHAELHELNPQPLIESLKKQGIDQYGYSLDARLDWLGSRVEQHPWLQECFRWLIENRPFEPERLSVCHGDFHPLNILVKDEKVSGVLDWGGFSIADPVFDIANTIVLTTIPAKNLSSSWDGLPPLDWDLAAKLYLSEYQIHRVVDKTNLDYYIVRRCLFALIQGVEGQKIWQHALIVQDLVDCIDKVTGMRITLPDKKE